MAPTDPTVSQAWLIAIPSAITALSTWYLNRKSVKTHQESNDKTTQAISNNADEIGKKISDLTDRVSALESLASQSKNGQILLGQKYTESMNALQLELASLKTLLNKAVPVGPPVDPPVRAAPEDPAFPLTHGAQGPPPSKTTVKVIEVPVTPIGKVKWEK